MKLSRTYKEKYNMAKIWIFLLACLTVAAIGFSFWGIPCPKGQIRKEIPQSQFSG